MKDGDFSTTTFSRLGPEKNGSIVWAEIQRPDPMPNFPPGVAWGARTDARRPPPHAKGDRRGVAWPGRRAHAWYRVRGRSAAHAECLRRRPGNVGGTVGSVPIASDSHALSVRCDGVRVR
jgi:hypothetical protein